MNRKALGNHADASRNDRTEPWLPAHASVTSTKDSSLFNFKYEMNVLPTADDQGGAAGADWTVGFGGAESGGPPSVSGGIMNVNFADPSQYFEFNNGDTGVVSWVTGYTIEIRARIVTTPTLWNFSVIALPGLGHNDPIPFLHVGGATTNWGDGNLRDAQINAGDNTDAYHVFRIARRNPDWGNTVFGGMACCSVKH